ncbi:MAG: hypothetical protein K2P88_15070 [Chitinophagaceae bacterium]|uniref:hypothetical protein n=1 Tax=unclassified Paraflavitalea TaxID=2798305 RepID=UPI003D34C557|nr:hypothetical protein [Chitinophagaceae bacterium]
MKKLFFPLVMIVLAFACSKSGSTPNNGNNNNGNNSGITAPPGSLGLNSFYKKYLDASGIPIVSSSAVADEALVNAKSIVLDMIANIPDAKQKMIENKLRIGIIGINERPTQMPEYSDLYTAFPGTDWDNRARAYGATLARPLTTDCEENLRCQSTLDRYKGEEILTHEFAHALHELGLKFSDPSFDTQLKAAFDNAKAKGLWTNTYAMSDIREYWAEGVQDWYNCNLEAIPTNGVHNQVNTRTELQSYDPMLYALCAKYFTTTAKHGCY